jgi:hypothetical protein
MDLISDCYETNLQFEVKAMFPVLEHRIFVFLQVKGFEAETEIRTQVQAGASAAANRGRPRMFIIRFKL